MGWLAQEGMGRPKFIVWLLLGKGCHLVFYRMIISLFASMELLNKRRFLSHPILANLGQFQRV